MTRSTKRFKPAIQRTSEANDKLLLVDKTTVPTREVKLPGQVRRMALRPQATEKILAARDAMPPPPGYCYTLDGRLVPLEEIQQDIDEPEAQAMFCEIVEITGSLRAAADALGITSLGKIKAYMTRDIAFQEAVEAAADRHRQSLYAHAVQRATVGIQKPIFGGEFKDQLVGYETVVSDTLLVKLLQRHFPEFRNQPSVQVNIPVNGDAAKLPDFSKMSREERDAYTLLLKATEPPEVIDAEGIEKPVPTEDEPDPNTDQN